MRHLITIAAGYIILVGIVFLFQRRLLYFPDQARPNESQMEISGIVPWPAADDSFRGFLNKTTDNQIRGTILVFHGNAGSAWHRTYYTDHLPRLGYRVLLAEYPGYSGRPGNLNQRAIVADGLETLAAIRRQFGDPVYLCGESLGAAVAAAVAAEAPDPPAGVIAITPWDSLTDLAQSIYWYLPVRILIKDTYDTTANLNRSQVPVVIAPAEHDEIIPKKHSLNLYQHLLGPKKLILLPNAGHNTWPAVAGMSWWESTMVFLNSAQTNFNREDAP